MIRCRLFGHVPVGSKTYTCQRCGRPIYFWRGQRTGWFLRPEGPDNEYVGTRWRDVEGRILTFVVLVLAVGTILRWWLG